MPPKTALRQSPDPSLLSDSDSSTDLYFRAQANHRPEMGESNAESVLGEEEIKNDVKRMKQERHSRKLQRKKRPPKITLANNVTKVNLQTDYSLYRLLAIRQPRQIFQPKLYTRNLRYRSSHFNAFLRTLMGLDSPSRLHVQLRRLLCWPNSSKPTNGRVSWCHDPGLRRTSTDNHP